MRKYKIFKRLLIVFLTVAVTISGIPINSYADYLEPEQIQVTDTTQAVAQKTKENNSDDSIKNEKGDKKNQVDENISKDVVNNDVINEKDIKPKDTSNKNLDANISDNINKEDSNDIYEDNIHIGENDKIDKQTENVNQDDNMNCGSDDNTESDNAVQEKDIKDDAEEENINDSDDKGSNNRTVKIDDNTDESTDGNKHQSNNEDSDVNDSENIDENTTTNRSDDNSNIDEESDDNNNNSDNENLDIDENIENQEDVHKDIDEEELSDDVEEITDIDLTDSSNLLSDTMVEEMSVVINNVAGRSSISVYIDSMMIDELEGSTQKVIKRPVDTEITLVAIDYDGADPTHIFNCWYIQTRSDENLFIPEDTITFKIQDYKAVTPWHSEEFEPKVESRIEIDGETEIEIPLQDSVTSEYTAIIYDQNDEEMEDSSVTWSINESIDGVEVDEKTGVLTVNDEANAGSFTLTGETNNGVEGNLLINLFSHETIAPPDVIADDDNNSINGNDADRENMEYSLNDNNGWIPYNPSYPPDLSGDVTIELRFVGTETESPSDSTILEFHYNYEENFNEDKEEYPDIVSDKRGYLSVKHYNISNQPEVDIDDRYKMFGSERYDGFIMQTPRKSFGNDYFNMYDESEEGSLYFEADYDDSHEPFNKAIAMWGYFVPEKTGYYQLYAYSDDGIYGSVTIDSNENIFVDEWDYQSPKTRGNDDSYYLQEGKIYPIYMDFFENRVDSAAFKLQMSFDENQIEDVPGSYLYPSTNDLSYIEEIPVYGINVEPETQIINLNEIDSISLSATITPENATNKNINWSSSDENIANVDTNGIVTLNEIGTVTITATTEDGSYEDSCVLTVVSEQPGNPDDYFYASDNKGTLVKYYPYRTTDKTEVVKKNIGVYRDIATLPDGSLVGITENGYLYKNIELGKHDRKNITPYHYNWYDDDEGDDDDDDDRIGYFYDVNALTCGPDGDLYYVKEYNGRIKRYDIYNDRIHDVINTRLNSRGDIVFLDSDTIYYTAYSRHNSYLVRVDLNTHQIEKISTLQEAPYGITALNNKLFVTYANGNRSYVDVYDADGNKLNSQSEQITNLKQVYGAAQGIEKHENSLELIGPYDYDYFYLNDKNGRIIKYYPETNTIEEVSNSWEIYLDIANKDNELVGVKDGGLYKNITTDPVLIKQVTNNTINSLTYNNGLYYFIEGSILYAYDPVKNNYISIVDVGYESKGDLVALNGDMYFLGNVGFNRTKLMKIDFNNNYKVTTIKQYFTRMMAIAVANDTLFVSYDNRVAKVNLPNGNLYDEFKIWSLNEIFGAAQGGYSTSIITSITINGPNTVNVPPENLSPEVLLYEAIIKDQHGNIIDEKAKWSLKQQVDGVTIDSETGALSITNQANSGRIIIIAKCGTLEREKEIVINRDESQVTNIIIDGADIINVPTQENSPKMTDYNAVIKDQYGNVISQDVSWSLKIPVSGVSINSTTGLLEATNQADAGTVTVVASSNGMHEEKIVTIEKVEPEVTNITINGESIIDVPTQENSPETTDYNAVIKDQYGNVINQDVSWALKIPVTGVSINSITGLLEVTNQAKAGTVVVVATSDGLQQEKQVTIEKTDPEVTNIIIDGASSINVPTQENSPETTDYNAVIKDQYGNVMDENISWSLKTPANGVSINLETGVLQITNQANAGIVIVMASSNGMTEEKTVTIEKTEPEVTNIIINGESIIDVPTQENSPKTTDYNAVIKDQYGNVISQDISWSLKASANGISINPETGVLQVTNQADAGIVVVMASSGGMQEEKTVTIEKAESEVTNITINGESIIDVPTQENSPETTDYNAVIKDQYGNVISQDVSWSLKTPVNGVSINPITGLLEVTNQVDAGTVVVVASSNGVQEEKNVTIKKLEPEVTNIIIDGASSINVPTKKNSPETTDYNAVIKDQYGNVMDENISWSLKAPVPGVSINPITGLLEVTNQADAGTVVVVAFSDGMQEEKNVTIDKAEPEVTYITINGESTIDVPTQKNSPETTDYNAVIKDQYGNVMDKDVSWSLKIPVTGVSINSIPGLLEVTNQADAGTLVVVASSNGMTEEKTVTIEKAESEVTNIIIDGASSINVPTQKNSPETTDYNAVIKDQYGNVLNKDVSWSLKTPANG
ncbi:Ig-like domain-containing protein, partial [Vallitalea longa]|uniref:Ig-like domain-containing protein n=1 Tax=Vallitalea longa TaxID=2936439 RepID=UPI002490A131